MVTTPSVLPGGVMSADGPMGSTLTPLLIMGSPRSGTTFLAHMVNRFFDMRVSRDNGTLVRFHGLLAHYEPLSDDANLRRLINHLYADHYIRERLMSRGLALSEKELFQRVQQRTYSGLIEAVLGSIAAERGKSTWGYKRASLARVTGESVNDLFPRAKFVHIIRDAREVVLSMGAASKAILERSWHFGAVDWASHVNAGRAIGHRMGPDRYHEIRYERLMAEPAQVLVEILDFCGGGADRDACAERIRREVAELTKSDNTEKWRQQLPAKGVRQIERVAGPLLRDLGYPLVFPDVAGRAVGVVELAYLHGQRLVLNLLRAPLQGVFRYRFEVLKGRRRARLQQNDDDADL
jgi:hypothetical protein